MIPPPQFTIARHDRLPTLDALLLSATGEQVDLSGGSVAFFMRTVDQQSVSLTGSATITDATAGAVRYSWGAGDTDNAGQYLAEFQVTFASGLKMTFPNSATKIVVTIVPDIDNA